MEKKFNLCDEKWILVRDKECNIVEVSLKDALLNAHNYECLSGELPTQDVAIMRLLLAILHTVFSRVDINGNETELENEEDAFDRWKSIWECGRIPEKPIIDYLEKWHDRFWLIHPERPFYQIAGLDRGTVYEVPKLNGEISESSNKTRLFSKYAEDGKRNLSYSQATRWLLYLIGFDDTSSKPTKEGSKLGKLPSPGIGWLGKLGLTYLSGDNLFKTLMFNFKMVNEKREPEIEETPTWEKEHVNSGERTEIPLPSNLAELYTIQSRRVLLNVNDDKVTGYKLIGGDFFAKENSFVEPMTIWSTPQNTNDAYNPRRHDISRQIWREFSTFYPTDNEKRSAGIVNWYRDYVIRILPKSAVMKTVIASAQYGDKDFFINNTYSDSLSMSANILSEKGVAWRKRIREQVEKCDELSKKIFTFAQNVNIANGGDIENVTTGTNAKTKFYYMLDLPFRKWLESINSDDEDVDGKLEELKHTVYAIVRTIEDEYSNNSSPTALVGRMANEKFYSVPMSCNKLEFEFNKIYKTVKDVES